MSLVPGVTVPAVDHGVFFCQPSSVKWTCLCFSLPVMFGENGAQQWVKTELRFYCEGGHLKVTMYGFTLIWDLFSTRM